MFLKMKLKTKNIMSNSQENVKMILKALLCDILWNGIHGSLNPKTNFELSCYLKC